MQSWHLVCISAKGRTDGNLKRSLHHSVSLSVESIYEAKYTKQSKNPSRNPLFYLKYAYEIMADSDVSGHVSQSSVFKFIVCMGGAQGGVY